MNQLMRRSMSAALQTVELPPEAVALIKEGSAKPMAAPPVEKSVSPPAAPQAVEKEVIELEEAAMTERPRTTKSRLSRDKSELDPAPQIVSMTVRVPAELPNALLRVAVERKLQRQKPCTQQEMVACAIRDWLRRNGYSESGTEL